MIRILPQLGDPFMVSGLAELDRSARTWRRSPWRQSRIAELRRISEGVSNEVLGCLPKLPAKEKRHQQLGNQNNE